jgi:ribosomal protein S16
VCFVAWTRTRRDPSVIVIDNDKAVAWLSKGAQPTETVEKLLKISGAWDQFKGTAPATPAPVPASVGADESAS